MMRVSDEQARAIAKYPLAGNIALTAQRVKTADLAAALLDARATIAAQAKVIEAAEEMRDELRCLGSGVNPGCQCGPCWAKRNYNAARKALGKEK